MEFCRFRDFAVPLLGLSTRHPSIHEMRVTQLVDSIFRAPHFPDAAGTLLCLSKLGSLQCFPSTWSVRRTGTSDCSLFWIADAHRDDGRRFIVHADEKLSAFVELERQVLTVTFYIESIPADS